MSAFVKLRLPAGEPCTVGPGAIIGRSFAADVRLSDGRVSEAHALISLRGGALVLFALRGRVRVGGRDVPRVSLEKGLEVQLAQGVSLTVLDLELPAALLAVEAPGIPRQVLTGVVSVCLQPQPHLATGVRADAAALLFSDGLAWFATVDGATRGVALGDRLRLPGLELAFVAQARTVVGTPETGPVTGARTVQVVRQGTSVHVWPAGAAAPCTFSGQPAQLLSMLLTRGGPVRWEDVSSALWEGDETDEVVRHRLDVLLGKLRRRFDDAGVRRDLVVSHRTGYLELLLYPGDQAHDRT